MAPRKSASPTKKTDTPAGPGRAGRGHKPSLRVRGRTRQLKSRFPPRESRLPTLPPQAGRRAPERDRESPHWGRVKRAPHCGSPEVPRCQSGSQRWQPVPEQDQGCERGNVACVRRWRRVAPAGHSADCGQRCPPEGWQPGPALTCSMVETGERVSSRRLDPRRRRPFELPAEPPRREQHQWRSPRSEEEPYMRSSLAREDAQHCHR